MVDDTRQGSPCRKEPCQVTFLGFQEGQSCRTLQGHSRVSRGEIIGSSNLSACSPTCSVILGLLWSEAAMLTELDAPGFVWDCPRVYFCPVRLITARARVHPRRQDCLFIPSHRAGRLHKDVFNRFTDTISWVSYSFLTL